MLEKYQLKYVGSVTQSSLYPESVNLQNPVGIHSHVLEAYKGFQRFFDPMTPIEKQTAIQCVSLVATFSLLRKPTKLPGLYPLEEWERAREVFGPTIKEGIAETSEATVRNGYLNLFKMLKLGVTTWEETRPTRKHNPKVGNLHSGAKPRVNRIPKY